MASQARTLAACLASVGKGPSFTPAQNGDPEWTPSNTMNRQVAKARREMGEARWAALNREWS